MSRQLRVEITGRDEFWRNAVFVEWNAQFPERNLVAESNGSYLIPADWLNDLARIAGECFSKVVIAPANPSRRLLFRQLMPHRQRQ